MARGGLNRPTGSHESDPRLNQAPVNWPVRQRARSRAYRAASAKGYKRPLAPLASPPDFSEGPPAAASPLARTQFPATLDSKVAVPSLPPTQDTGTAVKVYRKDADELEANSLQVDPSAASIVVRTMNIPSRKGKNKYSSSSLRTLDIIRRTSCYSETLQRQQSLDMSWLSARVTIGLKGVGCHGARVGWNNLKRLLHLSLGRRPRQPSSNLHTAFIGL